MPNALVIKKGDRFGKLTILHELPRRDPRRRLFKLKCDCGNTCQVKLIRLTLSDSPTRSCGCLANLGFNRTHGRSRDPIYNIWKCMRYRCCDPKNKSFPDYGGRGIKVCERWQNFENFLADMGERPSSDHELDRINNDGDYEPGNVRWIADGKSQVRNRRKVRDTTSKFRGLDWLKNRQRWRVRISIDGKVIGLGLFKNEEDAARAYDDVACQHDGFRLNFPEG